MRRWRVQLQRARADRAWRRWTRDWRAAVTYTAGEATVLPWRLRRLGDQVFHRLQERATALVRRGWMAPAPRPGEPERLPLPKGNRIHPAVWPLLLDAWTHARMDQARPGWFWPLLLGAQDRIRIRWLLDQGATHALTHTDVEALRQTRWHADAFFREGHWAHEVHDRTHRAWVVWLLRRGLTVAPDAAPSWAYHWPQIWRYTFPQGVPIEPIERAMRQVLRDNRRLGPADCEQLDPPRGMEGLLRWLARMEHARTTILHEWPFHAWLELALAWRQRTFEPDAEAFLARLLTAWVRLGMALEDPLGKEPLWRRVHTPEQKWAGQAESAIATFWHKTSQPGTAWGELGEALLAHGWPHADQLPSILEQIQKPVPELFWQRQAQIRQAKLAEQVPATHLSRRIRS